MRQRCLPRTSSPLLLLVLLFVWQGCNVRSFTLLPSPMQAAVLRNPNNDNRFDADDTTSVPSFSSLVYSSSGATTATTTTTALHMGKTRKTRRSKKAERSRPKQFYDAIQEAGGVGKKKPTDDDDGSGGGGGTATATATAETATAADGGGGPSTSKSEQDEEREARGAEARKRMEERPEVSTMIVDEETGIEVVAQGKNVMDVVTRKSVRLSSLGPEYRMAQFSPGVPMNVREKYRLDWNTVTVPEMIDALREACSVKLSDGTRGIPPHPSVANTAIDFVLANRDLLGGQMKKTLAKVTMRAASLQNKEEAVQYQKLWKNFLTIENHISAPFRQMILDAEGRIGPNFGNLDVTQYCAGELYERCANYIVLKGMVANWEYKVREAEYVERTPQTKDNYITLLSRGDPKRYLPDPPILFTLKDCAQVCSMSQQLCKAFVSVPELFDDLPPELRFLERALTIRGGAALRKFIIDEFCPAEGITAAALREGMRRLLAQLDNMQIDPYGDICNLLRKLIAAMSVGTDDGTNNPYLPYLVNKDPNGPGAFQTYTFNHDKLSTVRFLDQKYERLGSASKMNVGSKQSPLSDGVGVGGLGNLFGLGGGADPPSSPAPQQTLSSSSSSSSSDNQETYKVPAARAVGRPHELGWLDILQEQNNNDEMKFGKVPPGRIIFEGEEEEEEK